MDISEKLQVLNEVVEDNIDRRGRVGKVFTDGLAISTSVPADGVAAWETAVAVQGGEWHPVQRYDTLAEAERGHGEWIARAPELDVVTDIGTPGIDEAHQVSLRGGQ